MKRIILFVISVWMINYLHAQDFVWAKQMSGTSNEYGRSVAVDGSGNIYITGHFAGTVDFNPGAVVLNMTSAGGDDNFYCQAGSLR